MCDLLIERTYLPGGTNGTLSYRGEEICQTIELPWYDNQPQISCIPEGKYPVVVRETEDRGLHLWINPVPGRKLILIHSANNATKELKGCIAPVTATIGAGKGIFSRHAMEKLMGVVLEHLLGYRNVNLLITSK